ncbi:hypothetical protein CRUP_020198 [Coryphaenoides rupestris]|nr:hypothetical protein CRUP_020198 [Coryphaenoides rupestris]
MPPLVPEIRVVFGRIKPSLRSRRVRPLLRGHGSGIDGGGRREEGEGEREGRRGRRGKGGFSKTAILDDPMECSRGERLAITLAKDSINRSSNRSTTGRLEIMSKGVVAVLGPSASPASNSIISNICGEKELPQKTAASATLHAPELAEGAMKEVVRRAAEAMVSEGVKWKVVRMVKGIMWEMGAMKEVVRRAAEAMVSEGVKWKVVRMVKGIMWEMDWNMNPADFPPLSRDMEPVSPSRGSDLESSDDTSPFLALPQSFTVTPQATRTPADSCSKLRKQMHNGSRDATRDRGEKHLLSNAAVARPTSILWQPVLRGGLMGGGPPPCPPSVPFKPCRNLLPTRPPTRPPAFPRIVHKGPVSRFCRRYVCELHSGSRFKAILILNVAGFRGLSEVPYVKVAPEDILKVQFPRFTTLDLRPTNTDISLAVAGLLTFFNSTTACLICAQSDCEYGLLNLERLLRQFLISKETLSVRMLDDSQDPTPLLKEIRDDKTATIIVDANATMSHIILERRPGPRRLPTDAGGNRTDTASDRTVPTPVPYGLVRRVTKNTEGTVVKGGLGMMSVYYTYIFTSLHAQRLRPRADRSGTSPPWTESEPRAPQPRSHLTAHPVELTAPKSPDSDRRASETAASRDLGDQKQGYKEQYYQSDSGSCTSSDDFVETEPMGKEPDNLPSLLTLAHDVTDIKAFQGTTSEEPMQLGWARITPQSASELGMMSVYYTYIFTSLGLACVSIVCGVVRKEVSWLTLSLRIEGMPSDLGAVNSTGWRAAPQRRVGDIPMTASELGMMSVYYTYIFTSLLVSAAML